MLAATKATQTRRRRRGSEARRCPPVRRRLAVAGLAIEAGGRARRSGADPGHRMADCAQQPIRIADRGFDQQGEKASATDMMPNPPSFGRGRAAPSMAAISAPRGACSRARPNLSSICRPGSIPILIRCRSCPAECSRGCRSRPRSDGWLRSRRGPMARRRRLMSCAAPGTQILLPLVAGAGAAGTRRDPGADLCRARPRRALAGHDVAEVADIDALRWRRSRDRGQPEQSGRPDCCARMRCWRVAESCAAHGRLLVVDEAFMDVGPRRRKPCAAMWTRGNIVVLRSFGKFFGLAGLRLGFALAAPAIAAAACADVLGPWAVAGPAIAIGANGAGGYGWIAGDAARLAQDAAAARCFLIAAGLDIVGGTSLFRLAHTPAAAELFHHLGRAGILVRRFAGPSAMAALRFAGGESGLATVATAHWPHSQAASHCDPAIATRTHRRKPRHSRRRARPHLTLPSARGCATFWSGAAMSGGFGAIRCPMAFEQLVEWRASRLRSA